MGHLQGTTIEELQEALAAVEGKRPKKRLIAAIAYKSGVSQSELAEWFGVERKTIYNWLTRLESQSLNRADKDYRRTGRNRKISEKQYEKLVDVLHEPPEPHGYDAPAWTPSLTRRYLEDQWGVTYSIPSCRRLMKEAGLTYRTPRQSPSDGDETGFDGDESRKRWLPR